MREITQIFKFKKRVLLLTKRAMEIEDENIFIVYELGAFLCSPFDFYKMKSEIELKKPVLFISKVITELNIHLYKDQLDDLQIDYVIIDQKSAGKIEPLIVVPSGFIRRLYLNEKRVHGVCYMLGHCNELNAKMIISSGSIIVTRELLSTECELLKQINNTKTKRVFICKELRGEWTFRDYLRYLSTWFYIFIEECLVM